MKTKQNDVSVSVVKKSQDFVFQICYLVPWYPPNFFSTCLILSRSVDAIRFRISKFNLPLNSIRRFLSFFFYCFLDKTRRFPFFSTTQKFNIQHVSSVIPKYHYEDEKKYLAWMLNSIVLSDQYLADVVFLFSQNFQSRYLFFFFQVTSYFLEKYTQTFLTIQDDFEFSENEDHTWEK